MLPTLKQIEKIASRPLDSRIVGKLKKNFGSDLDYISGTAVLVLLNDAFGPYFSLTFSDPVVRQYRTLHIKNRKTQQEEDYQPREVVEVKCTISLPVLDEDTGKVIEIRREGFGSSSMQNRADEENVLKSAQTDAMKKAAYSFKIGLELQTHGEQKKKSLPNEEDWYNEHVFGVWNPNNQEKYRNELQFVAGYMKAHNLNTSTLPKKILKDPDALLTANNIQEICARIREEQQKAGS